VPIRQRRALQHQGLGLDRSGRPGDGVRVAARLPARVQPAGARHADGDRDGEQGRHDTHRTTLGVAAPAV
jgi:hypothetical protein